MLPFIRVSSDFYRQISRRIPRYALIIQVQVSTDFYVYVYRTFITGIEQTKTLKGTKPNSVSR